MEFSINNKLFKEIYDKSLNAIGITDEFGKYISINKAHVNLLGYSIEDLKGQSPEVHIGEQFQKVYKSLKEKGYFSGEIKCKRKDGKIVYCFLTAYKIEINGKIFYVGIKRDISQLKEKEQIIDAITNQSEIGFAIYKNKFIFVNETFLEKFGYPDKEIKNINVWDLFDEPYKTKVKENIKKRLQGEYFTFTDILPIRTKNNGKKWIYINASTITIGGEHAGLATFVDITEKKELEEKLYYLENFDTLTNLPNKEFFKHQLENLIKSAQKVNEKVAVILFDIFNFTEINDIYGKKVGDEILKELANRLSTNLHIVDSIARYGSDEFILAIKDTQLSNLFSYWTLEKLKDILKEPFIIDDEEIYLNYNIGASVYPEDSKNLEELIANAEIALKHAKKKGINEIYFFNKDLNESMKKKIGLISQLKKAIQFREFEVYFQPKIDLKTEKIIGAEALARWKISPTEFIPVLVEADLMFDAGCIITEKSLEYTGEILKSYPEFKISINMSFEQLKNETCPIKLYKLTEKYNVPAENVIIEITETETMKNPRENIERLKSIKEMGFSISIDDFGTGYSSLNYLKIIPATEIKIDRSFINDMLVDENDTELVKIIISIGKIMGLNVVAEGIETKEQLLFLKGLGCDMGQGFYFSPPVPFSKFIEIIKK